MQTRFFWSGVHAAVRSPINLCGCQLVASWSDAPYAVCVPVGPQPSELERLKDLIDSIVAFEPDESTLVMVDDHVEPRGLDKIVSVPASMRLVSIHLRRDFRPKFGSKGISASVLTGLAWIQKNTDARFVLKLDTDSLVIGSFRRRICEKLDEDRSLAMIGAYSRTPEALVRDWSIHRQTIRRVTTFFPRRRPWLIAAYCTDPVRRYIRRLHVRARAHGYQAGEHCLGGGYALSREFLDRMETAGYLDDPQLWICVDIAEDVAIGLHVRALGMRFEDQVEAGDVFGVGYIGLPYPPEELLKRGYAIIHAVKNDPAYSEAEIRAYFSEKRDVTSAASLLTQWSGIYCGSTPRTD